MFGTPDETLALVFDILLDAFKGLQTHHGLDTDLLGKSCSKTSCVLLHNFDPSSCHVKGESNMAIACDSSINALITCVVVFFSVLTD